MQATIKLGNDQYSFDLENYIDLSLCVREHGEQPSAFGIPRPKFEPLTAGTFVGEVAKGGSVNCFESKFCAHGNGTHTECVGHITKDKVSIQTMVKQWKKGMTPAVVVTLSPELLKSSSDSYPCPNSLPDEHVLSLHSFKESINRIKNFSPLFASAVIIRTSPNDDSKKTREYSTSETPYLTPNLCNYLIKEYNTMHIITDLPSVDRMEDSGLLLSHSAFWMFDKQSQASLLPDNQLSNRSITELAFIPTTVPDGIYLLDLQVSTFDLDAAPSRPLIYPITPL